MSVLVDNNTRLIVQGITGKEGTVPREGLRGIRDESGGGVTPGKGGTKHEGWPVFNTVADAVKATRRERDDDLCAAAVCRRRDSRGEDAGIPLIVCITEGIPTLDMVKVWPRS